MRNHLRASLRLLRRQAAVMYRCLEGARLTVLLGVAAAIGCLSAGSPGFPWLCAPVAVFGFACAFQGKRKELAYFLTILPFLFWAYALWRQPRPAPGDLSELIGQGQISLRAHVSEIYNSNTTATTRALIAANRLTGPVSRPLCGKCVLTVVGAADALKEGQAIELRCRVNAPPAPAAPWDFDYGIYLRRRGIFSVVRCSPASLNGQATALDGDKMDIWQGFQSTFTQLMKSCREHLLAVHQMFAGQEEGALLQSMVLGDRSVKLPDSIVGKFRDVGLSHVLAASGFNVTVVTGVTWWASRFIFRSSLICHGLSFAALLLYVGLAGPSASVLRAALMCAFVLCARLSNRSLYVPAALAAALVITLALDPGAAFDVGLQLSYAATASIVFGARSLSARLRNWMLLLPAWMAESVAVIIMAQAGVLPIQLFYFKQIGLLFLPANLFAMPLVSLVTVGGFISSAVVIFDWFNLFTNSIVFILDRLCIWPLRAILSLVDFLSSCLQAKLHLVPPACGTVAVYYVILTSAVSLLNSKKLSVLSVILSLLAVFVITWHPKRPALTIASFPRTLAVVTASGEVAVLGDTGTEELMRFLSFEGIAADVDLCQFPMKRLNKGLIEGVLPGLPKAKFLVIDAGLQQSSVPLTASYLMAIVTSPARSANRYAIAGGLEKPDSGLFPYSSAVPLNYQVITDIVKRSGARWILFNSEFVGTGRLYDRLVSKLSEIAGVRIVRSARHRFMLIAEESGSGSLALRQVYPE